MHRRFQNAGTKLDSEALHDPFQLEPKEMDVLWMLHQKLKAGQNVVAPWEAAMFYHDLASAAEARKCEKNVNGNTSFLNLV